MSTSKKPAVKYRAVVGITFPNGDRVEAGECADFGDATEWLLISGSIEEV